MKRNVVLRAYNRASNTGKYNRASNTGNYVVKTCSQVLFACAIYHLSKNFGACAGTCTCDCTALLKRPDDVWFLRHQARWKIFFVILDHFLHFYLPDTPKK